MAFNLARYNLNAFNVPGESKRYLTAVMTETVTPLIGYALVIHTLAVGNERVSRQIEGAATRFVSASGLEEITEEVTDAQLSVVLKLNYSERIDNESSVDCNIMPEVILTEIVGGENHLAALIYPTAAPLETVGSEADVAALIYPAPEMFELVSESASLEAIDLQTCVLTTTLRPGQKLIVDASSYNVLLDGENAIEIHSGDWLDELTRETIEITISAASGAGNLKGSILYTERYL